MEDLKAKLLELSNHLNEIKRLHDEIESNAEISLCLWPMEVQVGDGFEKISEILGEDPTDTYPFGFDDSNYHKSIFINNVEFFQLSGR